MPKPLIKATDLRENIKMIKMLCYEGILVKAANKLSNCDRDGKGPGGGLMGRNHVFIYLVTLRRALLEGKGYFGVIRAIYLNF